MRSVFTHGHPIPNLEHVGIVPVVRACIFPDVFPHVDNLHHAPRGPCAMIHFAVEAVRDVSRSTPQVADIFTPEPRLVVPPFAETEDNRSAGCEERVTHRRTCSDGAESSCIA